MLTTSSATLSEFGSSKSFFFFFNDTATTEIYTLSLHDALPISSHSARADADRPCDGAMPRRPPHRVRARACADRGGSPLGADVGAARPRCAGRRSSAGGGDDSPSVAPRQRRPERPPRLLQPAGP